MRLAALQATIDELVPVRTHRRNIRRIDNRLAVLENDVRLLDVMRGENPALRPLDDAALQRQLAVRRPRGDVLQEGRRQELGLDAERDVVEAITPLDLLLGFAGAFIAGLVSCKVMIAIVKKAKLTYFALYCLVAALVLLLV